MASRAAAAENVSSTKSSTAIAKAALDEVVVETESEIDIQEAKETDISVKKTTAKNTVTKKTATKKASAKKTVKKTAAKKTAAKKETAKKITKKTTTKKVAKKVAPSTRRDAVQKTKVRKAPTTIPETGPARRFPLSVQLALIATLAALGTSGFIGIREEGAINVAQVIEARQLRESVEAAAKAQQSNENVEGDQPVEVAPPGTLVAPPANISIPNGGLRGSGSATPGAVSFTDTTPAPVESQPAAEETDTGDTAPTDTNETPEEEISENYEPADVVEETNPDPEVTQ